MSMEDDSEINIGAPENEHLFPTEVKTIQLNQRHEDAAFDYQQHSYHSVPDKQNDRGASLSPPPLQNGYKEKGATLRDLGRNTDSAANSTLRKLRERKKAREAREARKNEWTSGKEIAGHRECEDVDKLLEFIQGTPSPATNGVHKKRRAKSKTSRHTSKGEVDSSADQGITNGNHTLIRTSSSSSDSSTLNQLSQASQPSGEKIVDGSDSGICLPSPNGLLMAAKSSSDDLEVGLDEQDFKQVNRKKNTKQVKSKFQYKQQEKLKRKPQVFNSTQRPPNNRHGANNQMSSESAGKQGPKGNEHTPINTNTPIDLGFSAFPALEAGGQVAGPKTSVSLPESTSVTDDEQDSVKSQPASCFSSHQSWANIAAAKKLLPASTHCNSISTSHEPANLSLPQCGGENAESASDTHHLHSTSASSTSQLSVETTHSNLSTSSPDSNQSIQSITTVSHAYSPSESAPSTSVLALASCTSATPQLFQLTDEPEPDGSVSELLKGELPANASQQAGDAPRIEFGTVMSSRDGRTDQQVKDILSTSIYEEGSIVDATSSTGDSIPLGNMHKLSYGNSPPLKYPSKPKAANQTRAVEFLDHRGRCKSYKQVNITFGCFDSATSLEDTPLMSRSYPSDNHLLPAVDSSSDVTTDQGNIIHWILSQRPATGRKVGTVSSPGSRSRRVVPPGTGKPVFVDKFNVTAAVRMLRAEWTAVQDLGQGNKPSVIHVKDHQL